MLAYWIKAKEKTVEEVQYEGLPDLQRMVGGPLELAMRWGSGDVLYVDEEGMFKYPDFIIVRDGHQPFAGNGVYVGRETGDTRPPKRTLAEVTAMVSFAPRSSLQHAPGSA